MSAHQPFHHTGAERHAEYQALAVLQGATFTDILTYNGLATCCDVLTPQGTSFTLHGSSLSDRRTWKTFLASTHQDLPTSLSTAREALIRQYRRWLLTSSSPRYQALAKEDELTWLLHVLTLVVTRHIMEHKYYAYTTTGAMTFADPRTALEMSNRILQQRLVTQNARLAHHIVKDSKQARTLIHDFAAEQTRLLHERTLLLLPCLPTQDEHTRLSLPLPKEHPRPRRIPPQQLLLPLDSPANQQREGDDPHA